MSRDRGACRFADGTVLFFVYDGTVDTCDPRLHDTIDDAFATSDADRSPLFPRVTDEAIASSEPAEIAIAYGRGSHWTGTASRSARSLVTGRKTFVQNGDGTMVVPVDGLPQWAASIWGREQ